jgi:hypothetical protein
LNVLIDLKEWLRYSSFDEILFWAFPTAFQFGITVNCPNQYFTNIFEDPSPRYQNYKQVWHNN